MTFTPTQIKALSADLDCKNVKQRSQSGRQLSYIEGWHAIAEANRIFGFDGWSRETYDIRCVSERERKLASGADAWGVTYTAKARIDVGGIIREGCGTGHGIDRDLGQAHESAIKEAETDAMKRALMTFGNQFGLALYDKEQAHVSNGDTNGGAAAPPRGAAEAGTSREAAAPTLSVKDSADLGNKMIGAIKMAQESTDLEDWGNDAQTKANIKLLLEPDQHRVRDFYKQRLHDLKHAESLAA